MEIIDSQLCKFEYIALALWSDLTKFGVIYALDIDVFPQELEEFYSEFQIMKEEGKPQLVNNSSTLPVYSTNYEVVQIFKNKKEFIETFNKWVKDQ